MIGRYLFALFLTIVLEGAVAYIFGLRRRRQLVALAIINILTHTTLNYIILILGYLGTRGPIYYITAMEIIIVLVEWLLLVYVFGEPKKRFLAISILANAISFLSGLLLFWT
jgi:hypothetical protein